MKVKEALKKANKHIKNGTLLRTLTCAFLFRLDAWFFARWLGFDNYYLLHRKLGFPLEKLKFRQVHGYYPNYKSPRSFNEKCNYLKLFSRNPILPIIVDRVKVRDFVAKKVGKEVLIPVLQIVDKPEDINFDKLPEQFVIKTNFASGQNIIVHDKEQINIKQVKDKLSRWLSMKYRVKELIWFAQEVERKIIVEKYLNEEGLIVPADYKFDVFRGQVKVVNVIEGRFRQKSFTFLDNNWSLLPFQRGRKSQNMQPEKPLLFKKMMNIASILGKEFDFMRVDLYHVNNKIYFGELTPYPGNGLSVFHPNKYDFVYGNNWNMELKYVLE